MLIRREFWWAAGTVGLIFLIWLLGPILTPFLMAAALAYLGDPIVDRIEARGVGRTVGVSIVFAVMSLLGLLFLLLLVPLLQGQIGQLIQSLPEYLGKIQGWFLPKISSLLGTEISSISKNEIREVVVEHWGSASGVALGALKSVTKSGSAVIAVAMSLLLVPVVTFYLLRDWDRMVAWIGSSIPRPLYPTVVKLAVQSDEVISAFVRGQLIVMLSLGAFYCVGLWFGGLELALLVGILAAIVSFVPYLGVIVGMGAGLIAMALQGGTGFDFLWVIGIFGLGQLLEGFLLTPVLVGDRVGLHPVSVIFAVLAGGQLFGFAGVLLALPVAAVIAVLLRHAHSEYLASDAYGADPDPGIIRTSKKTANRTR